MIPIEFFHLQSFIRNLSRTTGLPSIIMAMAITLCSLQPAQAQARKRVETSTDVLMFAAPVAGFVGSLVIGDLKGTKQIVLSGATNLALTYLLKYTVDKQRPAGNGPHAFPSSHTSISFQGAAFVQRRYGWKWGTPAYLLSAYVGWGRIYCQQHDWWDVAAGAAIGTASSYLFTRPFARKHQLSLAPAVINGQHPGFHFSATF